MENSINDRINQLASAQIPFLLIIDFEMNKPILLTEEEALKQGVFYATKIKKNFTFNNKATESFTFNKTPIPYEKYLESFLKVQQHIDQGNTFLLNLTFPTAVETDLTLKNIFEISKSPYKLLYKNEFVCFSPEPFISIRNRKIFSNPMKGTIDAAVEGARQILIQDEKEIAEHNTIVDLIRNDLSKVALDVKVNRFRYIEEIKTNDKTLLQLSSEIIGTLPEDYLVRLGELIFDLVPAGSVSGAPKKKTTEIIREVEMDERGYYTGVFFLFDGEDLDSAVMIRFIENKDGGMVYRSGGGITTKSDPAKEYQELIDKVYVPIY
ncbi:MAG: aminodeoxychorismate synthase component I [Bacteroidales bacterium]|nr:aminodeoxychorismate synthase component I [Bacteroidales bacterium]MDY0286690.1 aminodeoxychorismate synthase component I [Bacteroidales bacterium]HPE87397.1 aminodeoxychorismate synthase component I [Bacteroidales bacterium]